MQKPVGGEWILGNVLASDIESKLSSRIMQRQGSSESDIDAPRNSDSATRSNAEPTTSAITNRSSQNPVENISAIIANTTNSSGISMQPPSIDNTAGSGLW